MTAVKAKYRGWGDAPADGKQTGVAESGATMRALRSLAPPPAPPPSAETPSTASQPAGEAVQQPASLVLSTSLTDNTSLVPNTSLAPNHDYAHRGTRLTSDTSLTSDTTHKSNLSLWDSLEEVHTGRLQLFNVIVDSIFSHLNPFEQAVYLQLYRLSWGYGKPLCRVSLPRLAERAGMKQTATQQALKRLYEKGLIEKVVTVLGRGKEQGSEFRVVLPTSLMDNVSLTRNTSLVPNTSIKEHTIKDTHTNTASRLTAGVRVASRFTLRECRRYAESLRAEGVKNPGGYATKIHRSGEADELIARFLEPVTSARTPDASLCPDCRGTGFYEPGGAGKGVAKCKHERLTAEAAGS